MAHPSRTARQITHATGNRFAGVGTTTHRWVGSEELELLRVYVEGLSRREGQPSTVAELLKDGYCSFLIPL